MILVDTSIWIELLGRNPVIRVSADDLLQFVTCGPIVQEVLQGLRQGVFIDAVRDAFMAIPRVSDPLPLGTFLRAADIYREGRRKGFTIRSSINCLIAAVALENRIPVWHKNRDFSLIARYTSLEAVE